MTARAPARDDPRLRDKFHGAMLGTAVGDAIGAPFEGRPVVEPERLRRWARHPDPLRWTDDTHMAIGVAESLLEVGGFDGERMAHHLASRYHAEPWRGYGAGPPQVFTALTQGVPWDQAAGALFDGQARTATARPCAWPRSRCWPTLTMLAPRHWLARPPASPTPTNWASRARPYRRARWPGCWTPARQHPPTPARSGPACGALHRRHRLLKGTMGGGRMSRPPDGEQRSSVVAGGDGGPHPAIHESTVT